MEQILQHMRDVAAAAMRAVDVVVVDPVFGEIRRKACAVAGFGGLREPLQQLRECIAGHFATPRSTPGSSPKASFARKRYSRSDASWQAPIRARSNAQP
jgi:hypothetical protein